MTTIFPVFLFENERYAVNIQSNLFMDKEAKQGDQAV